MSPRAHPRWSLLKTALKPSNLAPEPVLQSESVYPPLPAFACFVFFPSKFQVSPLLLGIQGCDCDSDSPCLFDVDEPSGEYKLDMSLPYSRMVVSEILALSESKRGHEVRRTKALLHRRSPIDVIFVACALYPYKKGFHRRFSALSQGSRYCRTCLKQLQGWSEP